MNQTNPTTLPNSPALDIPALSELMAKPPPFAPGEAHFWTDPHIARQMLAAHLNPDTDAASRRPATIQRSSDWIVRTLALQPGDSLLDLGCGPGLYASRLALHGLHVTGVDFSQTSIDYARDHARRNRLEITYRCQDYLELNAITVYRNWFQDYTPTTIRAELEAAGFTIHSLWSDLVGTPYQETSDWIGIIASKPE